MSCKELRRAGVLARVKSGELTLVDAAVLMGMSYRQSTLPFLPSTWAPKWRVTRSAAVSLISPSSGLLASCSYSAMTCRLASRQNPIRAGNHLPWK
jgi:hypothetical protein